MSGSCQVVSMEQIVHLARLLSSSIPESNSNTSSSSIDSEEQDERDSMEVEELFQPSQDPNSTQSTFMMSQTSPSDLLHDDDGDDDDLNADDGMDVDILNAPTRPIRTAASPR